MPDRRVGPPDRRAPPFLPRPEVAAQILDAMRARIAVMDRDRRHVWCNREYALFFGRSLEEVIGRTTAEVAGRAVAEGSLKEAELALGGVANRITGWMEYPGSRQLFIERAYQPVSEPDGTVSGYIVIVRDMTETRRREEELAARTAQLEAILGNMAEGVNIIGPDARVVLSNAGFLEFYGFPAALGRPGTPLADYVRFRLSAGHHYAHEDRARAHDELVRERVAQLMTVGDQHFEESRPDGRVIEVRRRRLPDGGLISTYTDITVRKDAERRLRRQRDALRRAERLAARASLLGGVAHEINNPLAIILAQATLLEAGTRGSNRDRARKIKAAADRCARIVQTFMGLARRRANRRENVAFAQVVATAVDLVGYRLVDAGVALLRDVPPDLPTVWADPDQLVHLLANLLGNAQYALRAAPGPREIRIRAMAEPDALVVTVADNGPGIPAAIRGKVFDPFFTTKPETEGSGIGLALCRGIVADHGGTIAAEETPGGGATIRVRLPWRYVRG